MNLFGPKKNPKAQRLVAVETFLDLPPTTVIAYVREHGVLVSEVTWNGGEPRFHMSDGQVLAYVPDRAMGAKA